MSVFRILQFYRGIRTLHRVKGLGQLRVLRFGAVSGLGSRLGLSRDSEHWESGRNIQKAP